ncbi:MAG: hypothetical protein NC299_07670 [Lachnospiraceae bacterium]|nr:hypothetical protein [Ruminococcus sp.]MCM1275232.1 hypothetical protein [Lachnospiraceae bacterium]
MKMLIYSQDRKSVVWAKTLRVERNIGGGKDAKYMILACAEGIGGQVIAATYPEEKLAMDVLEKVYAAFADGAAVYKFD